MTNLSLLPEVVIHCASEVSPLPEKPTLRSPSLARALLLYAALFLGASAFVLQPATALAAPVLAPIPFVRAPCLPPSPSFCVSGYVTAAGTFTPNAFSADGDEGCAAGHQPCE